MRVLYNFKAASDYSSPYRSVCFWCHDTTLKKMFLIEKPPPEVVENIRSHKDW